MPTEKYMPIEQNVPSPALAGKAAKSLFPKMSGELADQIPTEDVANAVEEIVKTYRYIKAEYLVESIKLIAPIADMFTERLNETLRLAIAADSKQLDKISDFVLMHPDIPYDEKFTMYMEVYDKNSKRKTDVLKKVINGALYGAAIITAGKIATDHNVRKSFKAICKTIQKYWKHIEKMRRFA